MLSVVQVLNCRHCCEAAVSRRGFCGAVFLLTAGWFFFGLTASPLGGQDGPLPARLGLDARHHMQISPEDRCPVCGMKPIRYPKFASAIQLSNDQTYYFCSNGCMLKAWLHPDIFLKSSRQQVLRAIVSEYFSGRQVDADAVSWIAGSDIIGPMGPAMVAVQGDRSVKAFLSRHGGRRVFLLQELTDELWFSLTGKSSGAK